MDIVCSEVFSLNRLTGPILSESCFVRLSVCLLVCAIRCSFFLQSSFSDGQSLWNGGFCPLSSTPPPPSPLPPPLETWKLRNFETRDPFLTVFSRFKLFQQFSPIFNHFLPFSVVFSRFQAISIAFTCF